MPAHLKPVILLAFANDDSQHLPLLKKESQTIHTIFKELDSNHNRVEIKQLPNADTASVSKALLEHKDQLVIFHYGGHADPQSLRLQDGAGYIEGLSAMLGDQKKLKLVFLNGCATQDQVEFLLHQKVKAVIATRVEIGDQSAYDFSKAFYESFAKGNSLKECYEHACDFLAFKYKHQLNYQINKRSMGLDLDLEELKEDAKWSLFYNDPAVLSYRGVGVETDKIQADSQLITMINRLKKKVPVRILLAVSSHQKLPNGDPSPVNVYNEIALIKEYIYKLFIYSNINEKFDVEVYLLENREQGRLIVSSGEEVGATSERNLPPLTEFDLISWVIWNNLGGPEHGAAPLLSGLYSEVIRIEGSKRPGIQLFHRGEAIPDFVAYGRDSRSVEQQAEQVEAFFAGLKAGARVIDYHPDLFENEFEHHLRLWLKHFLQAYTDKHPQAIGESAAVIPFRNPYKGLKPYQYKDANLFFGRINEVDALRERLAEPQHDGLLAVIGSSGSGKSSLVRAGLFNRLKMNAIPGSQQWRILEGKIDDDHNLEKPKVIGSTDLTGEWNIQLNEFIENGRKGAGRLIKELMKGRPSTARLVLFFDQFEEVFTRIDDKQRAFRKQLLQFLLHFAQTDQGQAILTLRSEYFHRSLDFPDFANLMKKGQQVLLPPDDQSMMRIIVRPAMFSGLRFEDGLDIQVARDAGQMENTLPLVSYVLEQLADKAEGNLLTTKAYQELGGVIGVIQKQADLAVRDFDVNSEDFQRDFNFLFRKLITVDENGLVAKRPAPQETSAWPSGAIALKEELVDKRLLISKEKTLEIAHEALIKHWDVLKEWIIDVRSALLTLAKAGKEAMDWYEARQAADSEQAKLQVDHTMLWPHERLQLVYAAQELLGIDHQEMERLYPHSSVFIRKEYDRLLEELEFDFVDHQRRDDIGNRLVILGDLRAGVGIKDNLPDIVWCRIPGGKVFVEGIDRYYDIDPFYIARYSITLAQFNLFTEPKIYYNDKWWEGLPVKHEDYKPRTQSPEAMINRPAEWVNWYHAVAFCNWLSEQLGYTVRLPYEWEWQQAAGNGNPENIYPWGKDWEVNKANSSEGVGRLMAVGLYPHGQAENGAMDMAGNVYEWCYNAFEVDDPGLEVSIKRTTKGGSWGRIGGSAREVLRNSFRLGDHPSGINERGNAIRASFRLVADGLPESALIYGS